MGSLCRMKKIFGIPLLLYIYNIFEQKFRKLTGLNFEINVGELWTCHFCENAKNVEV